MTLDRVQTPRGELVLRRRDAVFEIISNGTFLMDSRDGRSERLLVRAALDAVTTPVVVLIGGLGVGFSLVEAVAHDIVGSVTVVEIEPAIVAWHESHLAHITRAALSDRRTSVVVGDLLDFLRTASPYDVICLDIDNGPQWTVTGSNARMYDTPGLELAAARLRPGGALAVWSAHASEVFADRLASVVGPVTTHLVEVDRGEPDVVYVARRFG